MAPSFARHIGTSAQARMVSQSIINIGLAMGLEVVAEGVDHDKRFEALGGSAHAGGVCRHDLQVGAHVRGQVVLVDDEQVAFGDAGAAFARDSFACGNVNHVDRQI